MSCIKHVFRSHVVFQFLCTNTIEDQVLENVSVNMDVLGEDDGILVIEHTHVLPRLLVNVPDFTYVCFKRTQVGNFGSLLIAFSTSFSARW